MNFHLKAESLNRQLAENGIAVLRTLDDVADADTSIALTSMLLAVCITGEISAIIDLRPRRMVSRTIMVMRPGHNLSSIHESPDFEGFFIVVREEKLNQLLPSLQYIVPNVIYFRDNPIIEITQKELESQELIYRLLQQKLSDGRQPYNTQTIASLCEVLFYNTLGIYTARASIRNSHPSRREELLSKFIALVDIHFRSERSVAFYARELCVTPKHLSAVLKEVSGKTAGEWIDCRVVLEAKVMLRKSGLTIQEISLELNFSNQSFFGKYFKHFTGMSPREYRMKSAE